MVIRAMRCPFCHRANIPHGHFAFFHKEFSCPNTIAFSLHPSPSPRAIPTRSPTRSPTPSWTPSSPQDPMSRVACETLTCTGLVFVAGEITTRALRRNPEDRPLDRRRDRLRQCRLRLRLQHLRRALRHRQAVAGHRHGRRHRRRRRPGHDVRLRHQRDARADADAHLAGPQARREALRSAQVRPDAVPASRRQVPGHRGVRQDGKPIRVDAVVISTQHAEDVTNESSAPTS